MPTPVGYAQEARARPRLISRPQPPAARTPARAPLWGQPAVPPEEPPAGRIPGFGITPARCAATALATPCWIEYSYRRPDGSGRRCRGWIKGADATPAEASLLNWAASGGGDEGAPQVW